MLMLRQNLLLNMEIPRWWVIQETQKKFHTQSSDSFAF